jgi:hypothetical protein
MREVDEKLRQKEAEIKKLDDLKKERERKANEEK